MLPDATLPVPASLMTLLTGFGLLFTAPSFRTFCGLACGFVAQTRKRTICGMLAGAGLSRSWSHDRAHSFFSRARWNSDDLGLAVARLAVALLVPAGEPVTVVLIRDRSADGYDLALVTTDTAATAARVIERYAARWSIDSSAPNVECVAKLQVADVRHE